MNIWISKSLGIYVHDEQIELCCKGVLQFQKLGVERIGVNLHIERDSSVVKGQIAVS